MHWGGFGSGAPVEYRWGRVRLGGQVHVHRSACGARDVCFAARKRPTPRGGVRGCRDGPVWGVGRGGRCPLVAVDGPRGSCACESA